MFSIHTAHSDRVVLTGVLMWGNVELELLKFSADKASWGVLSAVVIKNAFLHIVRDDFAADFRMQGSKVVVRFVFGGGKKLKTKQKPCSLFPVLMLLPPRNHVSLAGQCINIYFCSECCCTSVVSLWTTLASLTEKEHITAAWVCSLIHRISWFLALNGASVQVRFCPPVISNRDQRVIILHFGAASTGCWSVRVYSYTEFNEKNAKTITCLKTDTVSRSILRVWT